MTDRSTNHKPLKWTAPYVLGIDLGANSLGWAALRVDEGGNVVGLLNSPDKMADAPTMGVRIFEAGVDNYQQGSKEETRNVKRRLARQVRRQLKRRRQRIQRTFQLLVGEGWLPVNNAEPADIYFTRSATRDTCIKRLDETLAAGIAAHTSPEERPHTEKLLPYFLRAQALTRHLSINELGRVWMHLAQRRGFKSNRKADTPDDERGKVKTGINEIEKAMIESASPSLGSYLLSEGLRYISSTPAALSRPVHRIRARWTSRKMYEDEFELIWNYQKHFHGDRMNEGFKKQLHRNIFFQRPLRSQRDLIGTCELENGKEYVNSTTGEIYRPRKCRRAPAYFLSSQEFQYLQKINDLRIVDSNGTPTSLTQVQKADLADRLAYSASLKYSEIKKLYKIPKSSKINFELDGDSKINGNKTSAQLLDVFGEKWRGLDSAHKDAIIQEIWGAPSDEVLVRRAEANKGPWAAFHVTKEEARHLAEKVSVSSDYYNFSTRAIQKLLPHLRAGVQLHFAIERVYGKRVSTGALDTLPPVFEAFQSLRNPVVSRALNETRRVVNQIIRYYGKPTCIRIELARDLKQSKDERKERHDAMRENEKKRDDAASCVIREAGIPNPSREDVTKAMLWDECNGICPYTGTSIDFKRLFGNDVDIEHIIPLSRCMDDSFSNKTLCMANENRVKNNRTPWEAYGATTDRYEEIIARIKKHVDEERMAAGKLKRFLMQEPQLKDFCSSFASSQLNDTRYASKLAREYFGLLYGGRVEMGLDPDGKLRVEVGNGQATAMVRDLLGANRIIKELCQTGPLGKEAYLEYGKRADHRHHAVDAAIIAITNVGMIQQLSAASAKAWNLKHRMFGEVSPPWASFIADVRSATEQIVVSHRIDNHVAGALHKETLYGPRRNEKGEPTVDGVHSHKRIAIELLSRKDLENIVDPTIQRIVMEALGDNDPKKFFKNGANTPFLKSRSGPPVPIQKVRVRVPKAGLVVGKGPRLRNVDNDENHHFEIVEVKDPKKGVRWVGRIVNRLEAVRRALTSGEVVIRSDGFLFSVGKNEVLELDSAKFGKQLYKICGVSEYSSGRQEIAVSFISDARPVGKVSREGRTLPPDAIRTRCGVKVSVSPIGVIRPCRA